MEPAAAVGHGEPFLLQLTQRFAERAAADAEIAGQAHLCQVRSGAQGAHHDRFPQRHERLLPKVLGLERRERGC